MVLRGTGKDIGVKENHKTEGCAHSLPCGPIGCSGTGRKFRTSHGCTQKEFENRGEAVAEVVGGSH